MLTSPAFFGGPKKNKIMVFVYERNVYMSTYLFIDYAFQSSNMYSI